MRLTTTEFDDGWMADRHAEDQGNQVPTFEIADVPAQAVELALVCHDPDAPRPRGFTHWLLYGIPADTTTLGTDADRRFRPGTNDFGQPGYGGPRPPAGHGRHHYFFWLYALDRKVDGTPAREEFLRECGDAVVAQARVVGLYERR